MRKKTDKELGYIITDGMIDTIGNKDLTDAQVGLFMRSIVGGNRDYAKNDIIVKALVTAFIEQFKAVNKRRTEMIGRRREGNRERERLRREESSLARQKLDKIDDLCEHMSAHVGTCDNMSAHVRTCGVIKGSKDIYISPYNPPAGDKKSSSAKAEGHAPNGGPTTSPAKGSPGRAPAKRTGTKRATGGSGPTAAHATREDRTSASRGAAPSKKTGGAGNGRRTNLWDGAAVVVKAADAMMARHPNAKSSKRAVVRAIAATVEEEPGEGPETVDAIDKAHAAWCATDGWAEDKGQFVQALAAWIRNGGWRKLPPQKKKPAPSKGDEISFDASL